MVGGGEQEHSFLRLKRKQELKWMHGDPGSGVMKDPSKTFYFYDVLNFIFKRTSVKYMCML